MYLKKEDGIFGWHFSSRPYLNHSCKRIPLIPGATYRISPAKPQLCRWGLHASKEIPDAWSYVRGTYLSRVKLWGTVIESTVRTDPPKMVATNRTILWVVRIPDDERFGDGMWMCLSPSKIARKFQRHKCGVGKMMHHFEKMVGNVPIAGKQKIYILK
jgi:hypothetical protein